MRHSRVFWENGFRTVASIANADPNELVPILMQVRREPVNILESLNLPGATKQDTGQGQGQREVRGEAACKGERDIGVCQPTVA